MAFPTQVGGLDTPPSRVSIPPMLSSGGNVYVLSRSDADNSIIRVYKATDPESSFSLQDSGSAPNLTNNIASIWAAQVSDVIHIATQEETTLRVGYHTFNMATDTWGTVNETVITPTGTFTTDESCAAIGVRSDGDVIILYCGTRDSVMGVSRARVDYARKEGGAWTTGVAVDNGGGEDWYGGALVPGSSDRMHLFFHNSGAAEGYQRCLRSANTLETFPAAFDALVGSVPQKFGRGVAHVVSGTTKIRTPYRDSDLRLAEVYFDSADTPTTSQASGISGADVLLFGGNTPVLCYAVDDSTDMIYALYADASTSDLWLDENNNGAGWGTDTEIVDAISATHVSASVYTRGDLTVLAIVYANGATHYYTEIPLTVQSFLSSQIFRLVKGE